MTRSIPGLRPASDDDDGVRQLLATLPDPGPMPPDLVRRITASLAAEQERGAAGDPTVVPMVRRRPPSDERPHTAGPSRALLLGLGGVAAAVVVGGVVVVNALTPAGAPSVPGTSAQLTVAKPAPAGADPGRPAQPSPAAPDGPTFGLSGENPAAGGAPAPDSALDAHIVVSSRQYTTAELAGQAASLWRMPGQPLHPLAAETPAIGPIGTTGGVAECLAALGVDSSQTVVDLAFFNGAPAAIVVTQQGAGREARAVTRQCGPASKSVLAGPVTLP